CERKLYPVLAPVSRCYPSLTGRLPTCYSPVRRSFHKRPPEGFCLLPALDLHVLGTPPAFVLSQDQTLNKIKEVDFARLKASILLIFLTRYLIQFSMINYSCCFCDSLYIISSFCVEVNTFFKSFLNLFSRVVNVTC